MAFTIAKAHGSATRTVIFLVDPTNLADLSPFNDAMAHVGRILFNSDWSYLEIFYDVTQTLSLLARAAGDSAVVQYMSASHGLGSVPFAILIAAGAVAQGPAVVQSVTGGGASYFQRNRMVALSFDASTVAVDEWAVGVGNTLPAMSLTCRIMLLRPAPQSEASNQMRVDPHTGSVQFGKGVFSVSGNKKLKATSGAGLFALPAIGPTIDSSGQTLRIVKPDGSVVDMFGYTGSFTGSGTTKVTI